jgi:hypothetical protein
MDQRISAICRRFQQVVVPARGPGTNSRALLSPPSLPRAPTAANSAAVGGAARGRDRRVPLCAPRSPARPPTDEVVRRFPAECSPSMRPTGSHQATARLSTRLTNNPVKRPDLCETAPILRAYPVRRAFRYPRRGRMPVPSADRARLSPRQCCLREVLLYPLRQRKSQLRRGRRAVYSKAVDVAADTHYHRAQFTVPARCEIRQNDRKRL